MKKILGSIIVLLSLSIGISAHAQPVGQLGPGQVWGNPLSTQAPAKPSSASSIFDRSIGSTRGSLLERGSSGWSLMVPGTTALPLVSNGPGADPAYQQLTGAGVVNNTITYSKIQQVAASSLVGNSTGSLANAQGITLGSMLTFTGTTLQVVPSAITGVGSNAITNAMMAQGAANSFKGNPTASTANESDFTIASLTSKGSPTSADLMIISDQASSGATKKITLGSLPASVAAVPVLPKGANYAISTGDKGSAFSNAIASSPITLTLPACAAGLYFDGYVGVGQALNFAANGTDVITVGALQTASGGNISSDVVGSKVKMFCEVAGYWSTLLSGIWTVN